MDIKFKYFLFDWDGCLVNTLPIWFNGMREGLSYFNIDAPDNTIKKGFQGWDIFSKLGVYDMDIFTNKVYKYVENNLCNVRFNEGVIETLIQLNKREIKSAIVTSTEKEKVYSVLERLNSIDLFDCVIGRNDVKKQKPDCEAIDKALKTINGDKFLSAIVGDSEVDVKSGQNAGISTIWISSNDNKDYHIHINERELKPNYTITSFHELQRFF
jgi:HAD superfamily hydrolase (TIGR01549 family)